jgi:hypothetical protein
VPAKPKSVTEALERELAAMTPAVAQSTSAAVALSLARELDDASISATARAHCAKHLDAALERLRGLAPLPNDRLDDLAARRRRQRSAGT